MSLWIDATSTNAAVMAAWAVAGSNPCIRTLTKVPKSGLQRSNVREENGIGCQQTADAVGDVFGRQRRSGNVLDILSQLQRRCEAFACELSAPFGISNVSAIGLPIFENLDVCDCAVRVDSQDERDEVMLAHDLVGNEPTSRRN